MQQDGVQKLGMMVSGENLADETVSLTGIATTSSLGTVNLIGNALVEPTGVSSTASTGSISPVIPKTVEVGGVSFQSSVNSITNVIQVSFAVSGLSSTAAIGVVDPADQFMGLTGQESTVSQGTAVAPNEDVFCNGPSNNFSTRNSSRCNFTPS